LSLLFLLRRLKRKRFGLLAATALLVAVFSIWMAVLTSPTSILYVSIMERILARQASLWEQCRQAAYSSSIDMLELSG
jgi:4-amino-4-deoxy-L-arabinose transferase-like glycosyltransferase